MTFTLEPLTHADVPYYVRSHLEMTIQTYAHLVSPLLSASRWAERAAREASTHDEIDDADAALAAGRDPFRRHWVAKNERGGIVGVMASGRGVEEWEPDAAADLWRPPEATWALAHLYTSVGVHGSGLAQRMLRAGLPSGEAAYLWCYMENPRALAFYARNGFAPDGLEVLCGPEWGDRVIARLVRPAA